MKKILIALLAVCGFCAIAADTVITGSGTNTTGIGTFQVRSDGSSVTLDVDKINVLSGTKLANGASGNATIVTNVTNIPVTGYVTNVAVALTFSTEIVTNGAGNVTGVVGTNLAAVVTITKSAPVVGTSSIGFSSGVCTNKP